MDGYLRYVIYNVLGFLKFIFIEHATKTDITRYYLLPNSVTKNKIAIPLSGFFCYFFNFVIIGKDFLCFSRCRFIRIITEFIYIYIYIYIYGSFYIHPSWLPRRLLSNTPTASSQRGKTPPSTSALGVTLNHLMVRIHAWCFGECTITPSFHDPSGSTS